MRLATAACSCPGMLWMGSPGQATTPSSRLGRLLMRCRLGAARRNSLSCDRIFGLQSLHQALPTISPGTALALRFEECQRERTLIFQQKFSEEDHEVSSAP